MQREFTPQEQLDYADKTAKFTTKVFSWMGLGLLTTALIAYLSLISGLAINIWVMGRIGYIGVVLLELGVVIFLTKRINNMSITTARGAFLLYSALNGITFSVLLLGFDPYSVVLAFGTTSAIFVVMAVYGYVTKTNLLKLSGYFTIALVGLIVVSIINWFLGSESLYYFISYAGVAIFTGLIAYDVQKLKSLAAISMENEELAHKCVIMGALHLYLDFINLFIYLLRIFGKRR